MKKLMLLLSLIAFLCFRSSASAPAQENPNDLFQKALARERADGNLMEAIQLYRQIVHKFAKDRALAAKALVQIGKCYERLGNDEARNAYDRVLRDFGDQAPQVEEARSRLAALGAAGKGSRPGTTGSESSAFLFRKIEFPGQGRTHLARLSPDGTKILYVDSKNKEQHEGLYVRELSSGQEKRLVDGNNSLALIYFEWSPDGENIVYRHGRSELRIISSKGGDSKTLWSSADPQNNVYPMDWSRDGRYILCTMEKDQILQLAVLASSGGDPRIVMTIPSAAWTSYPQFSPDGKSVVGAKTEKGNSEIYIWTIDGGQEIRLTDDPANDDSPFWSPDGQYIVFLSDREKTRDLWAIPIQGVKPDGAPVRIKSNIGRNTWVTDCTLSGTLTMFMVGEGASSDLFVLSVNPLTAEPHGQLLPFAKYPTAPSLFLAFSPDGKRVAYTSRKGGFTMPRIFISSGRDKEDEEIPAPNYYVANIEWGRDGQSLLFPGWDPEGQLGIFRVSLQEHRIEPLQLTGKRSSGNVGAFVNLRWLPQANRFSVDRLGDKNKIRGNYRMDADGKSVLLVTDKISADVWTWPSPNGKYLAYLEGRDLKVWSLEEDRLISTLVQFPEGKPYEGPAWSPDGNQVALRDQKQLEVISLPGNTSRVLLEAGTNTEIGVVPWFGGLAWSPNGRTIAYCSQKISPESKPGAELWIMPTTGGSPRKIADAPATHPRLGQILWHSGGEMIFVTGSPESTQPRTYEHWIMENFLPKSRTGK